MSLTPEQEKLLKEIDSSVGVLIDAQRERSNIPTVPLDGLITALEQYQIQRTTGLLCHTRNCVLHVFPCNCGLALNYLRGGRCPHYNPKLKPEDVSPPFPEDVRE